MSRLLCSSGIHRWRHLRTGDGAPYVRCRRCGKDGDTDGVKAALRAGWWS